MNATTEKRMRFKTMCDLLVLLVFIPAAAIWSLTGFGRAYAGPGTITDYGFWSYPRYDVRLGVQDIRSEPSKTYRIRSLPKSEWTFGFRTDRPVDADDALSISMQVSDSNGTVIGHYRGQPLLS